MKHTYLPLALSATLLTACGGGTDIQPAAGAPVRTADLLEIGATAPPTATGGFSTATGSTDAPVTVRTLAELVAAFNAKKHHIIVAGAIYGGPTLTTLTFASTDWNNTTIEGAPGGAALLENIQLKFSGEMLPAGVNIENIIVKNITFRGNIADLQALPPQEYNTVNNAGVNYLGVSLRRVTNAWIDHCKFYDISDDLMSVSKASDNVTVSYNHFYFTDAWLKMSPDPMWNWVGTPQDLANERLPMVIGGNRSDSYTYGTQALHVTLHHNRFGPNLKARPLLRGWIHAYNNFFDNGTSPGGVTAAGAGATQYNAFQIGSGSVVYSESNYYYKTRHSNQIGLDSPNDKYSFYEKENFYNAVVDDKALGGAFTVAPVGYNYTLDPVLTLPDLAKPGGVGPR